MGLKHIVATSALLIGSAVCSTAGAQVVRSNLAGIVYDSIAGHPLAGARVQIVSATRVGWERSITTDATGRFRFDTIAVDSYVIGFYDAALDSLGLESPVSKVDVRDSTGIEVAMAVASANSIIAFNCRNQNNNDGMFVGFVRSAVDRSPVTNATVRVRWSEFTVTNKGLQRSRPFVDASTDSRGFFTVCKIPADSASAIQVRSWNGADSSGFVLLDVPKNRLLKRDIYIGKAVEGTVAERTNDRNDSTIAVTVIRGDGSVRGTIKSTSGKPIPSAHITVGNSGIETLSNPDGTFLLTGIPSGTYAVESRAIGFLGTHSIVDITTDGTSTANLVAAAQGRFLDTVRVMGKRPTMDGIAGFDFRRESGRGRYFTEEQIKKINPFVPTDLVRNLPSLLVTKGEGLKYKLRMRAPSSKGICTPNVFVDGLPFDEPDRLDELLKARDFIGVEVYSNWAAVPAEFMTYSGDAAPEGGSPGDGLCGAIILWTRQVSGSQRKK